MRIEEELELYKALKDDDRLVDIDGGLTYYLISSRWIQKWRDFIVPTEKDLAWTRIPWRTSFQQGLIESIEKHKPMLLWAMNGHPLGCT